MVLKNADNNPYRGITPSSIFLKEFFFCGLSEIAMGNLASRQAVEIRIAIQGKGNYSFPGILSI